MATVNVHHARAYLSKLLNRVAAGEEIVIARAGHPVARLIPFDPEELPKPGSAKGRFTEASSSRCRRTSWTRGRQ